LFGYDGDFPYLGGIKNNVMTEEIFKELGFERIDVSAEEAGDGRGFYYYSIDIGDICLITNDDEDAQQNGWWCSVFDSITLKIKGEGDLRELVKIVQLNTDARN
jgi:hypothetical protein